MEDLRSGLAFLGWSRDDSRWQALEHFLARVKDAGLPLVSRRDRGRLVERHLIPSLAALDFVAPGARMLDVGSGGGFPAIPIALARPDTEVAMAEANERKSAFLKRVSSETGLDNVRIVPARIERIGAEHIDYYDIVTARAVAHMDEIVTLSDKFVAKGGRWILWKGQDWRPELERVEARFRVVAERVISDGSHLVVLQRRQD